MIDVLLLLLLFFCFSSAYIIIIEEQFCCSFTLFPSQVHVHLEEEERTPP